MHNNLQKNPEGFGRFLPIPAFQWQDHIIDVPFDSSPLTKDSIYWRGVIKGYKFGIAHCGMPDLMMGQDLEKFREQPFLREKFSKLAWRVRTDLMKPVSMTKSFNTNMIEQGFDHDWSPEEGIKKRISDLSDKELPWAPSKDVVLLFFLTRYDRSGSCNGGKITTAGVLMMVDTGLDIEAISDMFARYFPERRSLQKDGVCLDSVVAGPLLRVP